VSLKIQLFLGGKGFEKKSILSVVFFTPKINVELFPKFDALAPMLA
jgi:hypothetical protein